MRLDSYLVEQGYFESRNRAQEAIKNGLISINNKVVNKASFKVDDSIKIDIKKTKFYVSRAAKKLEGYLSEFNIDFTKKAVLDVGSSTGGFTQIVLEAGAKSVDCVDVGSNQLHDSLRKKEEVKVYEETDIRDFKGKEYDIIVSDVSFISLLKIIFYINNLIKSNGIIVLLFKPQFEVGVGVKRDSKGVVIDKYAINRAKKNFLEACKELGWILLDSRVSLVAGKEGNIEEFYTFRAKRA